jgi:beta-lactamase regulating signal transducer with metallopeptidase domain
MDPRTMTGIWVAVALVIFVILVLMCRRICPSRQKLPPEEEEKEEYHSVVEMEVQGRNVGTVDSGVRVKCVVFGGAGLGGFGSGQKVEGLKF